MFVLGIDPGPTESAWAIYWTDVPTNPVVCQKVGNETLLALLTRGTAQGSPFQAVETIVIEQIASMGMAVGQEVFETCVWSGRFWQAWEGHAPRQRQHVARVKRFEVKAHLCQNQKARDANIRQALIDRYGGSLSIKKGGPLHGVAGDCWSALAVAVTYADRLPRSHQSTTNRSAHV
jgi:hypothetical protein